MPDDISILLSRYKELNLQDVLDHEKFNEYSIVHHSSSIEGSTLTEVETRLLLEEDITPKGKPLMHSLMVKDHYAALRYVLDAATAKKAISVEFIHHINALVMKNTGSIYNTVIGEIDASKGMFRKGNVSAGGSYFPNYDKVIPYTTELAKRLEDNLTVARGDEEQLRLSFTAHFDLVSVHPFYDGNGRTSRLLMNYIQAYHGLPLAIVFKEDKADYYVARRKRGSRKTSKYSTPSCSTNTESIWIRKSPPILRPWLKKLYLRREKGMAIRYFFNSSDLRLPITAIVHHRRRETPLLLIFLVLLFPFKDVLGQSGSTNDLAKKRVSDTILRRRTLVVPDPFDANRVLLRLFPGKRYTLRSTNFPTDRLISWICPACKPVTYADANPEEDPVGFPYRSGVATRLIKVFSYTDSMGIQYKLMSFNHSEYDPDGLQTGRFKGGLLGMAKFVQVDSGWRLDIFEPAIAAYGSFSQWPGPEPILIGDHQFAYMINHVNGGPGGPFRQDNYLIAEVGNSYRQILMAYAAGRNEGGPDVSAWTCTYHVLSEGKQLFRDIVIVSKGHYFANDKEGLPEELKGRVKGNQQGNFSITHVFSYLADKGYSELRPAKVWVERH